MTERIITITDTPATAAAFIRMAEAYAVPFIMFLAATVLLAVIFNKGAPE